ncbi:MAG: Tryptophan--tRNA ligase [Methanosaeta sp. PtaB.Bin039]|nr:MAG: Tryptophan--tRNA ligase [Methanosaeta sp. PtaB.Bin039]OPY46221.1 MAG: Tryptophan--tRNA ligase [Methanosaeta sp. PtaU1.Bin028]
MELQLAVLDKLHISAAKSLPMEVKLDPWGAVQIDDYSKLFEEFGISSFAEMLPQIDDPHPYMRRHIIFGHRNYGSVQRAMKEGRPFAVLSGFMPSGHAHFGHMMVMNEIIWHQQHGADAFAAVANMEAHAVRGISWELCRKIGIEDYLLSLIALGFQPSGHIYFQSENYPMRNLAFELAAEARFSEVSAIYGFSGETSIGHMESVMVQSADILHPQLSMFGGPKPVVIPVGSDQDAHIRLTRDLAYRMRRFLVEQREGYVSVRGKAASPQLMGGAEEGLKEAGYQVKRYEEHLDIPGNDLERIDELIREIEVKNGELGFLPPASIYHRFMTGLTGGKMSSSKPDSYIALTEPPKEAAGKVMKAITGGRQSLSEQRKLGGEPERCAVYEFLVFHLSEDDSELEEIYTACKSGRQMCGTCKKEVAERIARFLAAHQQAREEARGRLPEFGIKA